ncbi:MAG TPA: hypothetical protein VIF62_22325 [Labilithrix sp.]|jgi:hypothetical protein
MVARNDLLDAVGRLVEIATHDGDDRALRGAVNAVVKVASTADARTSRAAIARIAEGVRDADGRASQVLHLTLGALVEAGAPPELAWPIVTNGLRGLLEQATRFADACIERARDAAGDEEGFAAAAREVSERRPRDAAAWRDLPSRCLAAVSCLTRSRDLRKTVREDAALVDATLPLAEAVDEVGLLLQVLRMIDDEELVVVHAEAKRAFRVAIRDVASNAELLALLADALVGDGMLPGKRPAKPVHTALGKGKAVSLKTPFTFDTTPHGDLVDGVPADFPERNGARVVVLHDLGKPRSLAVDPSFVGLAPQVRVTRKLPPAEVERWLAPPRRAARRRR